MVAVPHPIPYQGSKRHLAPNILRYFPKDTDRLIEPFAGSAAVSLAAASAGKVNCFLLNDIKAPLMNLWNSIVHQPGQLATVWAESEVGDFEQLKRLAESHNEPLLDYVKKVLRKHLLGDSPE